MSVPGFSKWVTRLWSLSKCSSQRQQHGAGHVPVYGAWLRQIHVRPAETYTAHEEGGDARDRSACDEVDVVMPIHSQKERKMHKKLFVVLSICLIAAFA